ncbi:MAG: hypothetical protein WAU75_10325 [Solirubrobacteraceae bacterium]
MTTTISPQPVSAMTVTRVARREYQLRDEDGRLCASLRVGWPVRRGEISIGHETVSVRRSAWGQVRAGDGDQPLVRLSRTTSVLPGGEQDARWAITRTLRAYTGTLTRGDETMVIHLPALSGRPLSIDITGDWQRRDLVVLTACFALLARRRRDIAIMIAVSGSHGS